ncbi:carboxypeptidase M32 [Butyrivibrio sp. AE3004]|uniref:carboxypeptidase M32 n=1 Tax=Butyrivibrio sp. AE3004 TaxID=1506994 RepID=UPI00068A9BC9|nr:carboxypeptidase M32 [Butyrivibrio sp. AE3004]
MNAEIKKKLEHVQAVLREAEMYSHASRILTYDQETICPEKGMEEQGEITAFLQNQVFKLQKDPVFIDDAEYLYTHKDELEEFDRVLAEQLHRAYAKTKNITAAKQLEFSRIMNKAFVDWSAARKNSDFSMFSESLKKVRDANIEMIKLRDPADVEDLGKDAKSLDPSDKNYVIGQLIGDYERGITIEELDECFEHCKERLVPLLKKIMGSKKKIRTDFMHKEVTEEQQRRMTEYLIDVIGYDLTRGAYSTSEHPFTDWMGRNDIRITTHYYPTDFAASMYSIIHEGGHALFEMLQPEENYDHFIEGGKTLGMHESVSRMYENRIGRSRSFIKLIYPKTCEIFPEAMEGVSEEEFYEAINVVQPSLIRTESDEFTYTFHIIIRYEIEKEIINGDIDINDIPRRWKEKYEEYLGVSPENDREGVLQDVHWSSGFGYFPTYSMGNMYNAMYYNRMKNEIDIDKSVLNGDFDTINNWMKENVFKKADRLSPSDWIRDITGRDFTADDFLDYLEEKYSALYEI